MPGSSVSSAGTASTSHSIQVPPSAIISRSISSGSLPLRIAPAWGRTLNSQRFSGAASASLAPSPAGLPIAPAMSSSIESKSKPKSSSGEDAAGAGSSAAAGASSTCAGAWPPALAAIAAVSSACNEASSGVSPWPRAAVTWSLNVSSARSSRSTSGWVISTLPSRTSDSSVSKVWVKPCSAA